MPAAVVRIIYPGRIFVLWQRDAPPHDKDGNLIDPTALTAVDKTVVDLIAWIDVTKAAVAAEAAAAAAATAKV